MTDQEQSSTPSAALGYTIFYVADVRATIDFYTKAFGIGSRFITPENDYGELETGATTLAFAALDLAHSNLDAAGGFVQISPTAPPPGASVTLVVADVQAALEAAQSAGASVYVEPADKAWGQTVAYVRDPNGILIEVATAVQA